MGGWAQQTSAGWQGDALVFTGDGVMGGQKSGARDTFTKKADGSLTHKGEMQMKGKWVVMDEETCRKSK